MPSNLYSIRRNRITLPPVCKKKKHWYSLLGTLDIDVLNPNPPIPPIETVVLYGQRDNTDLFVTNGQSPELSITASALYHPSAQTWDVTVRFYDGGIWGGTGWWTFRKQSLPSPLHGEGSVTLDCTRISPDKERGTFTLELPVRP